MIEKPVIGSPPRIVWINPLTGKALWVETVQYGIDVEAYAASMQKTLEKLRNVRYEYYIVWD